MNFHNFLKMSRGLLVSIVHLIAMFMIVLAIYFDEGLSNLSSSKNSNKESVDAPRSPTVIIERLINLMLENVGVMSDMREWYFASVDLC